jgi:hypothetical protein
MRDTIDTIDMAREAFIYATPITLSTYDGWVEPLKAFEALVRADEREACAELAFEMLVKVEGTDFDVPDAIRARGQA